SIVFASGSTYFFKAGSNPFGAAAPSSVLVFQTGSLFSDQTTISPSFSGRTYANFELNASAANLASVGGLPLSIDNLTVTAGTLNLNLTGNVTNKGNISVASGATLTFTPGSPATNGLMLN